MNLTKKRRQVDVWLVEPSGKYNSVIDRLDSGRLVDNGMHQCRYSRGGCHQTAEALAAPIIEVRNMDPLKEAPAPWQIEVSEEL